MLVFCLVSLLFSSTHGATGVNTRHLVKWGIFKRFKKDNGLRADFVKPISHISLNRPSLEALESDGTSKEATFQERHGVSPFEVPDTWVISEGKGKEGNSYRPKYLL